MSGRRSSRSRQYSVSLDCRARLTAGHGRRVDQPQAIAPRGRDPRQTAQKLGDLGSELADALVVARFAGDVGEQMTEPPFRKAQEAPLLGTVKQDLGDRQADQLGVADPWLAPRSGGVSLGQEIVGEHIKCGQKAVEVGEHLAASVVDVAETRRPSTTFPFPLPDGLPRRVNRNQ